MTCHAIQSRGSQEKAMRKFNDMKNNTCTKYAGYAKLSGDEKFELSEVYAGVIANGDNDMICDKTEMVVAVELALDSDGDETMSCDEFNDAYTV
jgi:hypothetical protein